MEFDACQNFLSLESGCSILEITSCRSGCSSASLINSEKSVWVSCEGLPQSVTIKIDPNHSKSDLTLFGWYCWHSYTSNPAIVQLFISTDLQNYNKWATLQANISAGYQIFNIETIPKSCKAVKIVITETFGAENTYMNKIFLMEKIEKISRLEKKNKMIDESIVNISEISSNSHENLRIFDFNSNPKSKLIYQLQDLDDTIKNIKARQGEPEENQQINEIKGEIDTWKGKIGKINSSLNIMIEKISKIEEAEQKIRENNKINEFKKEIIEAIKKKKQKAVMSKTKKSEDIVKNIYSSKAGEILDIIHSKTEEKIKKIRQLQLEKLYQF